MNGKMERKMNILVCRERDEDTLEKLLVIWRASVSGTHTFLTEADIDGIARYVPSALRNVPVLVVAEEDGKLVGFAGVDGCKLEMLFLSPDVRGMGIGKKIVQYLFEKYRVKEVCVNEQNPQATGFYERMGFRVYKREELDGQGNPFPLLYMKL